MSNTRALGNLGALTLLVASVDLAAKAVAFRAGSAMPGVIHPLANRDFSLGIASAPAGVAVALMVVGFVAAALWCSSLVRRRRVNLLAAGLLLGGTLGNVADRAATGVVHDFLVLGPVVVNIADLAVLSGLVGILTSLSRARTPGPAEVNSSQQTLRASRSPDVSAERR